jgi:colanic acid biosynthesis glycosyl transferase WcaI
MRFRCRFVFICHDVHPDIGVAMGLIRNRALIAVWRTVNRVIRRRADRVVVVGRDMREKLEREGVDPQKVVYVPTWSSADTADATMAARLRDELGWRDRFVVMHAGNIGLAQNVGIFSRVAERLRSEEGILIVMMGDGAARPALEREITERRLRNLELLPYQPQLKAHALMAAADVHVVSLIPGLWGCAAPSKTYAVMAAARPFVAAVDPGSEPARIVHEWGCGEVVAPGDDRALAAALVALKEGWRDDLGTRARRGFDAQFSAALCIARLRAVIESV